MMLRVQAERMHSSFFLAREYSRRYGWTLTAWHGWPTTPSSCTRAPWSAA